MIADEKSRRHHQLDVAAAEQAAPEQQKRRGKERDTRRESIEGGARVSCQRDPEGGERQDSDNELVRNPASSDVTVSDDGEDADPEDKDQYLQRCLRSSLGFPKLADAFALQAVLTWVPSGVTATSQTTVINRDEQSIFGQSRPLLVLSSGEQRATNSFIGKLQSASLP